MPSIYGDTVRRLQGAVEKIGRSRVYLLPVHASEDANRTLGDAAQARHRGRLAALKAEVEGLVTSPPDRPSTLVRRLDAFESLQARANLYRDVLQVHVQDLNKTIAGLTASVEGTAEPEGDSVASRHASTGACSAAALSTLNHP